MNRFLPTTTLLAATMSAALGAANAEPTLYRGEFTLSFLGLTVAKTAFDSRVDENGYSVSGTIASAGLGAIFDDTKGNVSASGTFAKSGARPSAFSADYVSGNKKSAIDIAFASGNVTKTVVLPPPKPRGSDWIPLKPADLKSVADPIAATLIKANSLTDVCKRSVRFYEGELRADLNFSFVSTGKVSVKGYDGPTVTCKMRFKPVSGYRTTKKALDFLKNRSRIMVTFAPLGQTGIYAPVRATVGTEIGTISLKARRFEVMP